MLFGKLEGWEKKEPGQMKVIEKEMERWGNELCKHFHEE